jgi:hypothetical protein
MNVDLVAASGDQVQTKYFINGSIIGAQMNSGVAEKSFVLYWKPAGRQAADVDGGKISVGDYSDEWTGVYYGELIC